MATARDYQAIAEVFAALNKEDANSISFGNANAVSTIKHTRSMRIAHHLCEVFKADNERFNKELFLKACGF